MTKSFVHISLHIILTIESWLGLINNHCQRFTCSSSRPEKKGGDALRLSKRAQHLPRSGATSSVTSSPRGSASSPRRYRGAERLGSGGKRSLSNILWESTSDFDDDDGSAIENKKCEEIMMSFQTRKATLEDALAPLIVPFVTFNNVSENDLVTKRSDWKWNE